jgi:hypothetical protein
MRAVGAAGSTGTGFRLSHTPSTRKRVSRWLAGTQLDGGGWPGLSGRRSPGRFCPGFTSFSTGHAATKAKLNNASFVDKAPKEVVEQQRELVADLQHQIKIMEENRKELGG